MEDVKKEIDLRDVFGDDDSDLTDLSDEETKEEDEEMEDGDEVDDQSDEQDDEYPDYGVAEDARIRSEADIPPGFLEWETASLHPRRIASPAALTPYTCRYVPPWKTGKPSQRSSKTVPTPMSAPCTRHSSTSLPMFVNRLEYVLPSIFVWGTYSRLMVYVV